MPGMLVIWCARVCAVPGGGNSCIAAARLWGGHLDGRLLRGCDVPAHAVWPAPAGGSRCEVLIVHSNAAFSAVGFGFGGCARVCVHWVPGRDQWRRGIAGVGWQSSVSVSGRVGVVLGGTRRGSGVLWQRLFE